VAARPTERSPARRTNKYRVSSPTNTNGATGRTTAPNQTAPTSRSAGSREATGAPDQPSIRPARPEPASTTPSPTPPDHPPTAGHNKTPEGTAALLDVPPVRCKHRTGCRCEHRLVHPGCSGPLRARRKIRARPWVGEAPYPRDSENVGRSGWPRPQAVHGGLANRPAGPDRDVLATRAKQLVDDSRKRADHE
jgi:hypothetical protein